MIGRDHPLSAAKGVLVGTVVVAVLWALIWLAWRYV